MPQFTVRQLARSRSCLIQSGPVSTSHKSFIDRPVFFRLAFFFMFLLPVTSFASLKIAIVDSGFCPDKIKKNKGITINTPLDMTDSVKLNCKALKESDFEKQGRFHGQLVLKEFLKHLPKKAKVSIHPLVVYNKKGVQTQKAWTKAISWIEKKKVDLVLTASGLLDEAPPAKELPALWFMPSGRIGGEVKKETTLFPQLLAPKPNIFIIGDYFDGKKVFYDENLLYQSAIDYYFPSGENKFSGTSRAVAHGLGRAIEVCALHKKMQAPYELRLCLLKNHKKLEASVTKKEIKTY